MAMSLPPLGLDLTKLKFNACLLRADGKPRHKVFTNNPDGFAQLAGWLSRQGVGRVHACMEAAGTYVDALATYLHEAGHSVRRVNPAASRAPTGLEKLETFARAPVGMRVVLCTYFLAWEVFDYLRRLEEGQAAAK
jgi:hypothetical protein